MSEPRQILALGGGGFSWGAGDRRLDDHGLSLAGVDAPRIGLLPTASGDAADVVDRFYAAFPRERAVHLPLFDRRRGDLRKHLLGTDVLYVSGGSTANLRVLWRLHGVDAIVREAWERGVVIVGESAGACVLFDGCITGAFGPPLRPWTDGLGLLSGTFCPHFGRRRARYRQLVGEGLAAGWGVEDGVGLHFVGAELREALSTRADGAAAYVSCDPGVRERPVEVRWLG